jgi:hypothetical protein
MNGIILGWNAIADEVSRRVGRRLAPSTLKSAVSEGRIDITPGKTGKQVCMNTAQIDAIVEYLTSQSAHLYDGEARTLDHVSALSGGLGEQSGLSQRAALSVLYNLQHELRGNLDALASQMFLVEQAARVIDRDECKRALLGSVKGREMLAQHVQHLGEIVSAYSDALSRASALEVA